MVGWILAGDVGNFLRQLAGFVGGVARKLHGKHPGLDICAAVDAGTALPVKPEALALAPTHAGGAWTAHGAQKLAGTLLTLRALAEVCGDCRTGLINELLCGATRRCEGLPVFRQPLD